MPHHKSNIKRLRQAAKSRLKNRSVKSKVKTLIKNLEEAIANNSADVNVLTSDCFKAIDKAVKNNIFHANKGARLKSKVSLLSVSK